MKLDYPSTEQIPDLRRLWQEAFGDSDAFLDSFFSTGFSEKRCRCAIADGQVAAALYWLDCTCNERKLAYVYAVATAKAFRNRGICHTLLTDTHQLLTQQGYSGAILVPGSPELESFYARLGYCRCSEIREFSCAAAPEPVSLTPLSSPEFARLRRQLLPAGSVLQEGVSLDFLAAQAEFYAGDGILLAARTEAHGLFALELLGNTDAAPGILRALGAEKGLFRTPGQGKLFSMYCPFDCSPSPAYLGFAFD